MGIETAPAFQLYVKEWRSSRAVQRMSFSERGVYFEMLCEQWESLTLADDPKEVAALLATTTPQEAEIEAAWAVVRRKFVEAPGQPGRILNLRLEKVRKERRRFVKVAQKGGRARAEQARRDASGTFQPDSSRASSREPAGHPADIQPEHQPPSSTATASASASSSSTAIATAIASPKNHVLELAFERFWAIYPKKVGKDAARKAWFKRRSDLPPVEQLVAAVERQIVSVQWSRDGGQFIPNPSTWLHQGRWQDEPAETPLLAVSERTARNLASTDEAERIILDNESRRTGAVHGHHG